MILREIDAKCLTLHLAAAKYDVSVNTIIRWRRIAERGGYEALYRGLSETYSARLMGRLVPRSDALRARIRKIYDQHKGRYRHRRITIQLRDDGVIKHQQQR